MRNGSVSHVAIRYINLSDPTDHGYTQTVSRVGLTHGQFRIENETYSLSRTDGL